MKTPKTPFLEYVCSIQTIHLALLGEKLTALQVDAPVFSTGQRARITLSHSTSKSNCSLIWHRWAGCGFEEDQSICDTFHPGGSLWTLLRTTSTLEYSLKIKWIELTILKLSTKRARAVSISRGSWDPLTFSRLWVCYGHGYCLLLCAEAAGWGQQTTTD